MIALRGRKPFRACFIPSKLKNDLGELRSESGILDHDQCSSLLGIQSPNNINFLVNTVQYFCCSVLHSKGKK